MAITTKARAKGLLRDARALLEDKTLPAELLDALGALETALRRKWADLEAEAAGEQDDAAADGAGEQPTEAQESAGAQELIGEIVPLVERKARNGSVPIKMIAPGWGSSGYYSAELLKRDGPKAFPAGTQMFWNHATRTEEAERPEGDLSNLAAVLTATPTYQEHGAAGPGLYSEAKVFSPFADALGDLAPHIGVSIRGQGVVKAGEAAGRKGLIVEKLLPGRSVDFVTQPGAGGQVLSLFEAARNGLNHHAQDAHNQEGEGMDEQMAQQLQEANRQLTEENRRLAEALLLREARDLAAAELARIEMPELTRARLTDVLAGRPVLKEGKLDHDAFKARIAEVAKDELAYLAGVAGTGRIAGMGSQASGGGNLAESVMKIETALRGLGLSESAAKSAAAGR